MKAIGTQGVHIQKNGTPNAGTRFLSCTRTCTAAESNGSAWYPIITFTTPATEFPDFVFTVDYIYTIHDTGNFTANNLRATWVGKKRYRGYMYWSSSSDRGWGENAFEDVWSDSNFYGFVNLFGTGTGAVITGYSVTNKASTLSVFAEVYCNRWDLVTVSYTTS